MHLPQSVAGTLALVAVLGAGAPAWAEQAAGTMTVNGKSGKLSHAAAMEVDSATEPGYLDVRVVLSDRVLAREDMASDERLEQLTRRDGLVALRVVLNPDAKVMSAAPYHPAFTSWISSGVFVRWEPSAYAENVAGRFHTGGPQKAFGQAWEYDVTFSAPIQLDPKAVTVPAK